MSITIVKHPGSLTLFKPVTRQPVPATRPLPAPPKPDRFEKPVKPQPAQRPAFQERTGNSLNIRVGNDYTRRLNLARLDSRKREFLWAENTLQIDDFQLPEVLKTDAGRQETKEKLLKAIYPELLTLLAERDKNPLWEIDFNQRFNKILNRELFPQGPPARFTTEIGLSEPDLPARVFRPAFKATDVGGTNVYQSVTDGKKRFLPETSIRRKMTPAFYAGHLGFFPKENVDSRPGRRELKNSLDAQLEKALKHLSRQSKEAQPPDEAVESFPVPDHYPVIRRRVLLSASDLAPAPVATINYRGRYLSQ